MARRGILTGGTWCIDYNYLVDAWPGENDRAEILRLERNGGGAAFNLAVDIKSLDPTLPVATIGVVGDDSGGRFILEQAKSYAIDCSQVQVITSAVTDYTQAFSSQQTGRRTNLTYFGAGHLLTPEHFDLSKSEHRILHLGEPGIHKLMDKSAEYDPNGWVTVLKKARAVGVKTNLEMTGISGERLLEIVVPCMPYLDLLIVNDIEIAALAGLAVEACKEADPVLCASAARSVLDRSAVELVVVHFPSGALAISRSGGFVTRPSVQVPPSEVRGANGAGDAFAAGFLYAYHEGWSIYDALGLAHATAVSSLRRITATDGVGPVEECLALAKKWGWRETATEFRSLI